MVPQSLVYEYMCIMLFKVQNMVPDVHRPVCFMIMQIHEAKILLPGRDSNLSPFGQNHETGTFSRHLLTRLGPLFCQIFNQL